jgi:hypothetical protein
MIKRFLFLFFVVLVAVTAHAGTQTTSSTTAATIIERVRLEIWEPSARTVSNADLITWINDGVVDIVNKTGCLEETTISITIVADQYSYDITTDFLAIEGCWYDSEDTTDPIRVSTLIRAPIYNIRAGQEKERGRPKAFAIWDNDLIVWPIPTSDHAGDTLNLYAIAMPTTVTSVSDTIGTPYFFDQALVYYVAMRVALKHGDKPSLESYKIMYDLEIKNASENIVRRTLLR